MIVVFRKSLLTFVLGGFMVGSHAHSQEHKKQECQTMLLESLEGRQSQINHSCKVTNKLVMWLQLQKGAGDYSFEQITQFIKENPSWPNQFSLRRSAEKAILSSTPPQSLATWFDSHPPLTTDGALAYLMALKVLGQEKKLATTAKKVWVEKDFSKSKQDAFLKKYSAYINRKDHHDRLERLLWEDHPEQTERLLPFLAQDIRGMAEARMAFKKGKKSHVPARFATHEGVVFDQVRSLRKQKRFDDAAKLILQADHTPQRAHHWWNEAHYIAREFMEQKRFGDALALIVKHKLKSGENFATAEWTAGWLNLCFLNNPVEAAKHFDRLYQVVRSALSLSRAAYWAGRAFEAMKNPQTAAKWYNRAAEHPTTYYGQLAAAKLRLTPYPQLVTHTSEPSVHADLLKDELVQAIRILSHMGDKTRQWARPFVLELAGRMKSDHEKHTLLDYIAQHVPHETVWFARKAGGQKPLHITQAYPHLKDLPLGEGFPEPALPHAIAYQESRFDMYAVSHAGAMGLMQLMPYTAKDVAKRIGVQHVSSNLISDPKHNVLLGTHNLQQMLERFDGSYILAIAAYNAGEEPVKRWIEVFGDPRKDEIDIIDWIELIPYYETRNYVMRVLENLGPYRLVLEGQVRDTIIEDLQK